MKVAVVGAGISGLAAARALVLGGAKVEVFEAQDRVGGLIRSRREDGYLLEEAANGFLVTEEGAAPVCAELGVELCEAAPTAKNRWIFSGGRLRPVPTGPRSLLSGELISRRGVLRAAMEPLAPRRSRADEDDESVAALARRRLGSEIADKLVTPFVAGVFAGDAEELSAKAAFPRLSALEDQGGFAVGLIRQALAARKQGRGRKSGSRLSAPRAGLEALPLAMAASLGHPRQGKPGADLRLRTPVTAVAPDGDGVALTTDSGQARFAAAILAVPASVASRLLADAVPDAARALGAIPFVPVAVAHLGFREADIDHPLDGFGFLSRPGENLGILGALFESSLWPERAPDGCALIRVMLGGARDPDTTSLDDAGLIARSRRALDTALGVRKKPQLARAKRIPSAIAQYTAAHSERVATAEAGADKIGVALCGMSYRGVGVNDAIRDGVRAATSVLARIAVVCAMLLGAACSGASQSQPVASTPDDSGPLPATEQAAGEAASPGAPGAIAVHVRWKEPPRAPRQMLARTPCGSRSRPRLRAHLLGGVAGFVVTVPDAEAQAPDQVPALFLDECRFSPAVQVLAEGAPLTIALARGPRQRVIVEHLGERGLGEAKNLAEVALAIPGQGYELSLPSGISRAYVAGSEATRAYIATGLGASAVTDHRGRARIEGIAPGEHQVLLWHEPLVPGGDPLTAKATAKVQPGQIVEVTLWLDQ